jgi:hypothetical protein
MTMKHKTKEIHAFKLKYYEYKLEDILKEQRELYNSILLSDNDTKNKTTFQKAQDMDKDIVQ